MGDARIFAFADKLDLKLAAEARRKGCVYCKGILHSAAYFRSPRHSQVTGKVKFYGLCCSKEGCRRRTRPKSIRFAGKSPYNTSFFLFLRLLSSGPSKRNCLALSRELSISLSTTKRWICCWRRIESNSVWWRTLSSGFYLSGKDLCDLWSKLLTNSRPLEAFELLLERAADLWPEIRFIGGKDPPAEVGLWSI